MTDLERLKAFSPTLFLEAAVKAGDVEAIQQSHADHCVETGCVVGEFGGHSEGCYCFTYQLAIADAKEVRSAS